MSRKRAKPNPEIYSRRFTKLCSKCKEVKWAGGAETEFSHNRRVKDGFNRVCKACVSLYDKEYSARNAEKRRARARAWNAANPERYQARQRQRTAEKREQRQQKDSPPDNEA